MTTVAEMLAQKQPACPGNGPCNGSGLLQPPGFKMPPGCDDWEVGIPCPACEGVDDRARVRHLVKVIDDMGKTR